MVLPRPPHQRQPATAREPKRLLKLLNYLGALNILGIIAIILSERHGESSATPSFPLKASTQQSLLMHHHHPPIPDNGNRHKGINETILRLEKFGINVDVEYPRLPPWWWIEDQYGTEPKILGLDRCEAFRRENRFHPDDVVMAPSGLFNSGTNLLYQLLQLNCHFPNRSPEAYHGLGFQPPWGKHTPREFRDSHRIDNPRYEHMVLDAVLPIVLMRHPYDWFKSICEQPYAIHWRRGDGDFTCPAICHRDNRTQPVLVTYGSGDLEYESIAHLYNRWNRGWYDTMAVPRLQVRMEDLIFYPDVVVPQICACAGATLNKADQYGRTIKVPKMSAKLNMTGHKTQHATTFLSAVIKYGNVRTWERFPLWDHVAARAILDKELMDVFGYQHPDLEIVQRNKQRNKLD